MDVDSEEHLILLGLLYCQQKRKRKKNRKIWEHSIIKERPAKGCFNTLFQEIRGDEEKFFNFTRMSVASFDELLGILKDSLIKQDTLMRKSISPEEKLVITIR